MRVGGLLHGFSFARMPRDRQELAVGKWNYFFSWYLQLVSLELRGLAQAGSALFLCPARLSQGQNPEVSLLPGEPGTAAGSSGGKRRNSRAPGASAAASKAASVLWGPSGTPAPVPVGLSGLGNASGAAGLWESGQGWEGWEWHGLPLRRSLLAGALINIFLLF